MVLVYEKRQRRVNHVWFAQATFLINTIMTTKQQSAEFNTLMFYIKELHRRYFNALSAFFAYEALMEVTAPNIVGESKANENVKVVNHFKNFFLITKEALRVYFFLELAKMFDVSKQSLHINKIINFTESNLKHLTVEAFGEYNQDQDREFLEQLTEKYGGVDHIDLMKIRDTLAEHEETLERLETYRNKWLAHNDKKKLEPPKISGEEIKELFDLLAKILNSLSGKLNSESWSYSHIEDDVKHHTRLVIDHLRRFEPYRLKEIEDKYQKELSVD